MFIYYYYNSSIVINMKDLTLKEFVESLNGRSFERHIGRLYGEEIELIFVREA